LSIRRYKNPVLG